MDEEVIEYQGTEYVFNDELCDISFSIKQSVDYSIISYDDYYEEYECGYYEHLESNYHEVHEHYVESSVLRELRKQYSDKIMVVDSLSLFYWDNLTLHVIVDIFADEEDQEYAIGKFKEISSDAALLLRKYDRHNLFGKNELFSKGEYIVNVELDRSWLIDNDFRQYDVLGKYYAQENKYVEAKRDMDGITLPEYMWEDEECESETYDKW